MNEASPAWRQRWTQYRRRKPNAGLHDDLSELASFLTEEYESDRQGNIASIFKSTELILEQGDEHAKDAIKLLFLEALQNQASWKPSGARVFVKWLGPLAETAWDELNAIWSGKDNLADVIRTETGAEISADVRADAVDVASVQNPELRKILESIRRKPTDLE